MAAAPDHADITKICSHCDRAIPSSNIDLHYAHCSRNLEKCKICDDMVPRKHADEHYSTTHAPTRIPSPCSHLRTRSAVPNDEDEEGIHVFCTNERSRASPVPPLYVSCSLCNEMMEREILAVHKGEKCPKRIVTCDYCEFPLPATDLFEHQEVCGNRTELCHLCNRYIRLRERVAHEVTCNGVPNNTAEIPRAIREAEREHAARRPPPPPPQDFSTRRLLFTIAITGIAILLGSLLFKENQTPVN